MTRALRFLPVLAALALACGDDSRGADAGNDATASDVVTDTKPDAPLDATNESGTDAGADAADAGADAATDASGSTCSGGCKLFSYDCANTNITPCTCLALSGDAPNPTCDAGVVSCFADPCAGKNAACVSGACVVQ